MTHGGRHLAQVAIASAVVLWAATVAIASVRHEARAAEEATCGAVLVLVSAAMKRSGWWPGRHVGWDREGQSRATVVSRWLQRWWWFWFPTTLGSLLLIGGIIRSARG